MLLWEIRYFHELRNWEYYAFLFKPNILRYLCHALLDGCVAVVYEKQHNEGLAGCLFAEFHAVAFCGFCGEVGNGFGTGYSGVAVVHLDVLYIRQLHNVYAVAVGCLRELVVFYQLFVAGSQAGCLFLLPGTRGAAVA